MFNGLIWLMVMCASLGMASCGGDDDDNDGGGGSGAIDVQALVGRSFKWTQETYGGNIETKYYEIAFYNTRFVNVRCWGNGIDADGTYRWDYGASDCDFSVSGNTMTIHYVGTHSFSETLELTFKNNKPVGWEEGAGVTPSGNINGESASGTSEMFGYYSSDAFRAYVKSRAEACGNNVADWNNLINNNINTAFRIVDGSTIWLVYERVHFREWDAKGYVYQTETYRRSSLTYTLYYYIDQTPFETYRYVMNGSKLVISGSSIQLEYKNGKLYYGSDGSVTYTKK